MTAGPWLSARGGARERLSCGAGHWRAGWARGERRAGEAGRARRERAGRRVELLVRGSGPSGRKRAWEHLGRCHAVWAAAGAREEKGRGVGLGFSFSFLILFPSNLFLKQTNKV